MSDLVHLSIHLYRGDTDTIPAAVPDGLTIVSWRCQARDGEGGLLFDLSGSGAPPAEIEVDGDLTDGRPAGQYSYDIECLLADGGIRTIQHGYITLKADVTSAALPAVPIETHGLHVTPVMYDALAAADPGEGDAFALVSDVPAAPSLTYVADYAAIVDEAPTSSAFNQSLDLGTPPAGAAMALVQLAAIASYGGRTQFKLKIAGTIAAQVELSDGDASDLSSIFVPTGVALAYDHVLIGATSAEYLIIRLGWWLFG